MKRIGKMAETGWVIGTVLCALGVVLCTKANFGLSMFAAPPYILHVVLRSLFPWYTQGTSEYVWQFVVLVVMCLSVQRFRIKYLLSFLVAFLFGLIIDLWLLILGGGGMYGTLPGRILAFVAGQLLITFSVALVFRSYMPAQLPECIVMELSQRYGWTLSKVKLAVDGISLLLSFTLSLVLTGGFTGVGIGTVIITATNAPLITLWGKLLDRLMEFDPAFPRLRAWLEKI